MSRYSGKCDFADIISIHSMEEILGKYQIYARITDIVPLRIDSMKELVVYYPFLVSAMYSNKVEGGCIFLCEKSFIDQEENENMLRRLEDAKRYYRKCKRNKISFNKDECLKKVSLFSEHPNAYEVEIVNRVAEFGEKATVDNIHDSWHDGMRDEWYQLMLDNGWDENRAYRWVYGWDRWIDKIKADKYGEGTYQETLDIN